MRHFEMLERVVVYLFVYKMDSGRASLTSFWKQHDSSSSGSPTAVPLQGDEVLSFSILDHNKWLDISLPGCRSLRRWITHPWGSATASSKGLCTWSRACSQPSIPSPGEPTWGRQSSRVHLHLYSRFTSLVRSRETRCRVLNSPSSDNVVLVVEPACLFHGLDHLLHTVRSPGSQVEGPVLALLPDVLVDLSSLDRVQRRHVTLSEIDDMEVVSDTSPVDGGEVVTEDFQGCVDPANGDGGKEGQEVVGLALGVLADLAGGMSTTGA